MILPQAVRRLNFCWEVLASNIDRVIVILIQFSSSSSASSGEFWHSTFRWATTISLKMLSVTLLFSLICHRWFVLSQHDCVHRQYAFTDRHHTTEISATQNLNFTSVSYSISDHFILLHGVRVPSPTVMNHRIPITVLLKTFTIIKQFMIVVDTRSNNFDIWRLYLD